MFHQEREPSRYRWFHSSKSASDILLLRTGLAVCLQRPRASAACERRERRERRHANEAALAGARPERCRVVLRRRAAGRAARACCHGSAQVRTDLRADSCRPVE